MIGVIANPSEHVVVREFFELFKTPWEFYQTDQRYDVLLCTGDHGFPNDAARLILVYHGHRMSFDSEQGIPSSSEQGSCVLSYREARIPIYGDSITLHGKGAGTLIDEKSQRPVLCMYPLPSGVAVRIGYDLFGEVRTLLTTGQPAANAGIPTLELHIALLRDLIVENDVPLVEIPPVPDRYRFLACLTHDVNHPSIRRHKFDHTMLGFLYRSTLGSLWDMFRNRASLGKLLKNWAAVLRLPFVYMGLARDFWLEFDQYTELEDGSSSTFFVIPFEGCPGQRGLGPAPRYRASKYGAADVAAQINKLMSEGCEIGLHGIDAWRDSSAGHTELEEIRRITGKQDIGVRMHWLYGDERSPAILEKAGADYDSTVGYNETVGYRAGTTQVYRPLDVTHLLELPLHVMDTALFFPSHLDLSPAEARKRVAGIIDNAIQFGGSVVVNWHDRSIAPERLWTDTYVTLVEELKSGGAWFATASQAAAWFRMRRSATFEVSGGRVQATLPHGSDESLPRLTLRTHGRAAAEPHDVVLPVDTSTLCSHAIEAQ